MKSGANERFSYVGKERKRPRQVVSGDLGRGAGADGGCPTHGLPFAPEL